MISNPLIYGKDQTERIVCVENNGEKCILFIEQADGTIETVERPSAYWTLFSEKNGFDNVKLGGDLHYKWLKDYKKYQFWQGDLNKARMHERDFYTIYNTRESYLVRSGVTYYKGMNLKDVSVLSFDIETNGLTKNEDSKVFCIANTLRKNGILTRKVFTDIQQWVKWVQEMNPSILLGHNIFGFDLPYLDYVNRGLALGRNVSNIRFSKHPSEVRKDASQKYSYFNATCFGREIVDTFHLALHYDIARKYPDYTIKNIAKFEGLAREGRVYYDAGEIGKKWHDPVERKKIIDYAVDDTDEALAFFDLAAPSFFYSAQAIPKSFQQIVSGASGAQVNSMMVRSYIQQKHSIPKASEPKKYEGAEVLANPGIYSDVRKVDVASLYPSIILQYNVFDQYKDPQGNFLNIVEILTEERLKNKKLSKETGNRYYKDLEQAQKIVINSAYGFLGATGLNFNSPDKAEFVCKQGKEILSKGIQWLESKGYALVNADTDSFSYTGSNQSFESELVEINSLFPDRIKWENDGEYKKVIVLKEKNYVLQGLDGKVTIKGSSLKDSKKEPALRDIMRNIIDLLLTDNIRVVLPLYESYVSEIMNVEDISRWATKITVTKKTLEASTTRKKKELQALENESIAEGDKVYMFPVAEELCLVKNFKGDYNRRKLLERLYDTVSIFSGVLDITQFPKHHLKKAYNQLAEYHNLPVLDIAPRRKKLTEDASAFHCQETTLDKPSVNG